MGRRSSTCESLSEGCEVRREIARIALADIQIWHGRAGPQPLRALEPFRHPDFIIGKSAGDVAAARDPIERWSNLTTRGRVAEGVATPATVCADQNPAAIGIAVLTSQRHI